MFGIGLGEMAVLVVLGLAIFGDKLPQVAEQAGRAIRQFREITDSATADLTKELGPEFKDLNLSTMNPKAMVRDYLLDDPPTREDPPTGEDSRVKADFPDVTQSPGVLVVDGDHRPAPFDTEAT